MTVEEDEMEKQQIGCMSGFLQIFDRQQFLAGKRVYAATTKRLSSSPTTDLPSPPPSPEDKAEKEEVEIQNAMEFKEGLKSPWKFRESPRLSLDSQAVIDSKGSVYPREIRTAATKNQNVAVEEENERQRRSPSVVARLMGLEMLPELTREPLKKQPELRRTNSESKCRDSVRRRFADNVIVEEVKAQNVVEFQKKRSKFDSQDFYPEVKEKGLGYGELEKRLKMRGISEPAEDLESLKQILEALQLKGLLHSRRRKSVEQNGNPNFIFDQKCTKPSKSPPSSHRSKTVIPRNNNDALPPRRRSPDRSETNVRSPSRNKPLTVETRRKRNDSVKSPTQSPKITSSPRKNSSDKVGKSPRNNRKSIEAISFQAQEESSSVSATTQSERFKREDSKDGNSLLERCDKLLNSMVEFSTPDSQPSPVSVLDSSFYKDELSPLKRCVDFKDQSIEQEEDNWSPLVYSVPLNQDDADFNYVSKIIHASNHSSLKSDLFLSLEKQSFSTKCSVSSLLHRKLVFDAIMEILDKKRQLLPPKATGKPSIKQVWLEFSKIREPPPVEEDMFEVICGALRKDLAYETINAWGDCGMEKSEMVLDIERLIFKDLVGDTIQELATFTKCRSLVPKKLVF